MRIGASLLLKNGFCYQSYRWQFLRPLGTLQNAVRILEERQVDEISIIRYCRDVDDMDLFKQDVDLVSNIDCITPLSFGGGIRDMRHIQFLHQLPIERILLSSGYIEKNKDLIMELINLFGKQAMIAVLPYKILDNKLKYYHCRTQRFVDCDYDFINSWSNEVMLYNTQNEGMAYNTCSNIIDLIPFEPEKVILSGGINANLIKEVRNLNYAAVSIDNSSLHTEFNFYQL